MRAIGQSADVYLGICCVGGVLCFLKVILGEPEAVVHAIELGLRCR